MPLSVCGVSPVQSLNKSKAGFTVSVSGLGFRIQGFGFGFRVGALGVQSFQVKTRPAGQGTPNVRIVLSQL